MANGGRATYKLTQPDKLPESGFTSAKFKPWQTYVLTFLEQDEDSEQFLSGGTCGNLGSRLHKMTTIEKNHMHPQSKEEGPEEDSKKTKADATIARNK